MNTEFLNIIDETLNFTYVRGGLSTLSSNSNQGWFSRPTHLISHCVKGSSGQITFKHSGKTLTIHQGDTLYIPAGVSRKSKAFKKNESKTFAWSHVYFAILGDMDLLSFFNIPTVFRDSKSGLLKEINIHLAELFNENNQSIKSVIKRKKLGMEMLSVLLEDSPAKKELNGFIIKLNRYKDVFSYIKNNCEKSLNVKDLAKKAHLSPSRFHRVFKEICGVSPLEYVRNLKMKKAQELLLTSDVSISELADRLGFSDQFAFSKSFRNHCGISPTHYRENTLRMF